MSRSLALCCALLLAGSAAAEDAKVLTPSDFYGVWKLDKDRSDPSSIMLKALQAPWYARAAMSSFTPTLDITALGSGLSVTSTNPIGSDEKRDMPGDGSTKSGTDALGRSFTETTTWQKDGRLLLVRNVEIETGKHAKLQSLWSRSGADLVIETTIETPDGETVKLRRVFAPVPKSASALPLRGRRS